MGRLAVGAMIACAPFAQTEGLLGTGAEMLGFVRSSLISTGGAGAPAPDDGVVVCCFGPLPAGTLLYCPSERFEYGGRISLEEVDIV